MNHGWEEFCWLIAFVCFVLLFLSVLCKVNKQYKNNFQCILHMVYIKESKNI